MYSTRHHHTEYSRTCSWLPECCPATPSTGQRLTNLVLVSIWHQISLCDQGLLFSSKRGTIALCLFLFDFVFFPELSMVLEEEEREDAQPITRKSEIHILDTRGSETRTVSYSDLDREGKGKCTD